MSAFRVGAKVHGAAGELGTVEAVVIDPTSNVVTHVVVSHAVMGASALVPLDSVVEATPDIVTVSLDADGLKGCAQFEELSFNAPGSPWTLPEFDYQPGAYFLEPYASPVDPSTLSNADRLPKGDVTIRRHDEVYSSDGTRVGHVDEFLVDPADGHVTHVVLREGHALGHDKDVVVPITGATIEEGRVVLGLDLPTVHELERIPVRRHGHVS